MYHRTDKAHTVSPLDVLKDSGDINLSSPSVINREDGVERGQEFQKNLLDTFVRIYIGEDKINPTVMQSLVSNNQVTGALHDFTTSVNALASNVKGGKISEYELGLLPQAINPPADAPASYSLETSEATINAEKVARTAAKLAESIGTAMPEKYRPRNTLLNKTHPVSALAKPELSERETAAIQLAGIQLAAVFTATASKIQGIMEGDAPLASNNRTAVADLIKKATQTGIIPAPHFGGRSGLSAA